MLWVLYDLVFAGDPLYSLTGTRDTVETLARDTGLCDFIRFFPRRLGEILREPVLLGAAGGGMLTPDAAAPTARGSGPPRVCSRRPPSRCSRSPGWR